MPREKAKLTVRIIGSISDDNGEILRRDTDRDPLCTKMPRLGE